MNDIHSSILYSAIPIYVHVLVIFLLKIHSILVIRNKRIGSKEKFENLYLYRNFKRTYLFLTYHVDPVSLLSLKQHVKITFYKQFSLSFSLLPPPPLTLPPFYLLLFPSPPLCVGSDPVCLTHCYSSSTENRPDAAWHSTILVG